MSWTSKLLFPSQVIVSNKGASRARAPKKHVSRPMQVVAAPPPQQQHTVQQPPPRSYMEEEHLSRRHSKFDESQLALPGHRYHEDSQLQVCARGIIGTLLKLAVISTR